MGTSTKKPRSTEEQQKEEKQTEDKKDAVSVS